MQPAEHGARQCRRGKGIKHGLGGPSPTGRRGLSHHINPSRVAVDSRGRLRQCALASVFAHRFLDHSDTIHNFVGKEQQHFSRALQIRVNFTKQGREHAEIHDNECGYEDCLRSCNNEKANKQYKARNPAVRVIEVHIETPYPDRIRKRVKTALESHVLFAAQSICNTQLLSEERRDVVNAPPECAAADALLQDNQDQRHSLAYAHRKH